MNILLIEPSFKNGEKAYPLGLGQLGAILKGKGHTVFGVDLSFNGPEEIKRLIIDKSIDIINVSAECYGISLISYSLAGVVFLCREIKKLFPSLSVVVNGPYAAAFKGDLLKKYRDCFDYLITGQRRDALLDLIEALEGNLQLNLVNNLIYLSADKIISNDTRSPEVDLDSFPFSDRELFPIQKYQGMFTKRKRYTQIITSIGCNHRCSYCPEPGIYACWRGCCVKNVVEEIKLIADRYRIEEFHIEDANFFGGGTNRVKEFCRELLASGLKIAWQCPNGIPVQDIDDLAVFSDMAESGCYSICLSVESFDEDLQRSMGKACEIKALKRIVNAARKEGIEVTGYFMIGMPGQAIESIKRDIKLSRDIGFDFINYTIFYPYPGSLWYRQYVKGMNIDEIFKNDNYVAEVENNVLKQQRRKAYLLNSFKFRTLMFAVKSFLQVKLPLRFVRRVISCIFDWDLRY